MQNILKKSFASKNKEGRGMCRPNTAVTYVFPMMSKILIIFILDKVLDSTLKASIQQSIYSFTYTRNDKLTFSI
jgi:hypothetical protein